MGRYDEDSNETDQLRQADAEAALSQINRSPNAVLHVVQCPHRRNRHRLAVVYKTAMGPVLEGYQSGHDDLDIRRVRSEREAAWRERGWSEEKIAEASAIMRYSPQTVADPLDAPVNRRIETSCRCGTFVLDIWAIRDAIAAGAARSTVVGK